MNRFDKKGLSGTVETILLILLVIAAIGILMAFLIPFVNKNLEQTGTCLDTLNQIELNKEYSCSTSPGAVVGVNIGKLKVDKILISLSGQGSTKTFEIEDGKSLNGVSMFSTGVANLEVPGENEGKTYNLVTTFNVEQIRVAPIVNGKQCDVADQVFAQDCSDNVYDSQVICGDNTIQGAEQCEDGNTDNGDGCTSSCRFEQGFLCDANNANCVSFLNNPNVAYFKFNENSGNTFKSTSTSNAKTGTITAPINSIWASGKEGFALNFSDNVGDGSNVPNLVPIDAGIPTGADRYSVSMWIKPQNIAVRQLFLTYGGNNCNQYLSMEGSPNNGYLSYVHGASGSYMVTNFATNAQEDTWIHLAVVYDGINVKTYINGLLKNNVVSSRNYPVTPTTTYIGGSCGYPWKGSIDEVILFDNRALTDSEVKHLYDSIA